jgi:hypothetical protein
MGAGQALLSGVPDLGQDPLAGVALGVHLANVEARVYSPP